MKKLSWGTKLAMFASVYVIGILVFVGFSTTQDINLISKDYYPQGIAYQSKIDKIKNVQTLKEKVLVSQKAGVIQVQFPEGMRSGVSGSIIFYRPSNSDNDLRSDINIDTAGLQVFESDKFINGRYAIKIDWKHQGEGYYQEEAIYLSK
ncbi:hypothetical protein DWB61_07035 [Ancylomarina euxinus]|uniref:Nitrogen fixation protein FixH n=1 Tax=Ancylomarina euxinus TaxID=2283627 RepID=A0A425Y3E0_9BACT|nr:FixH family protein [Ancylomarina euxinus]MCZ4693174.1 FixH family protein [Ancylomarina euxinus]MUP15312.1 hypothetical protein [Ancylomarina euxinus]RRG22559.1 hypothetical protein DWB61_07035 [Ancylomarina euxinus]